MSTLKVNTITTVDGTGNITVSRPLSGSGASLTNLPAANLTGALPAISGAALTNLPGGAADEITTQTSDPTASSPATPTLGDVILNTTTGEMFSCTTVSSGANVWVSVGSVAANLTGALPAISGASLTALNATQLTSGTLPDARLPAILPAKSGVNLTALNATQLTSGTLPDARLPATLPAKSGVNLTALNATQLTSGTLPDARFGTLPAVSGVNLTALNATNLGSGTLPDARFPATLPATSGANLTALPAGNLTGTVADARISALTASKLTGALPAISGASLTNLPAPANNSVGLAQLAAGTDGNIITYDASGDPAHVATGTAGHVLTSGGAGVAPTFAANSHIPADNSVTGAKIAMGSDAAGDVLTYNGTDYIRLAKGTAAQVFTMNAGATAPEWAAAAGGSTISDAHDSVLASTHPTSGENSEGELTEEYDNGSSGVGATLTNGGTQAAFAVDGMDTVVGSRILVKNQMEASQNGIYTVTTVGSGSANWVLTRATDADTPAKFSHGAHVFVAGGSVNEGTAWYFHTPDPTSPLVFDETEIAFRIFLGGHESPYSSSAGDILYYNGTKYARLTAGGSANKVLTMNSSANAPTWTAAGLAIPGSSVAGDTLYHNGTIYTRLAKGTAAQVLKMNAGATAPEWATDAGGIAVPGSSVAGDTLYHNGTIYTRLAKGTAAQVLTMNSGATAPEWAAAGGGGAVTTAHAPVKAASTGNLNANYADNGTNNIGVGHTLTNDDEQAAFTLDGETLEVGDRVLIKDQTTASANGVYTVTTVGSASVNWVLTRATDADTFAEIGFGNIFMVSVGSVNDETAWYMRVGTFGIGGSNFGGGQIRFGQIVNTRRGNEAQGDTLYHDGTVYTRLAKGTAAQVLTMNSGATAPEWAAAGGGGGPTKVSTTLNTAASSYEFSSLPAGITRFRLCLYEVSFSGTDDILIQLGDAGGFETSAYLSTSGRIMSYNGTSSAVGSSVGFVIKLTEAAGDWNGIVDFSLMGGSGSVNYWVSAHSGQQASTTSATAGGGNKPLSAELTQIRYKATGSNTFTTGGAFVSRIDLFYWQD